VALGAASVVALGTGATAGASEPTVIARCLVPSPGLEAGQLRLSGFPPDTTVNFFAVTVGDSGQILVYNGLGSALTTDADGSAATAESSGGPEDRPVAVGAAVYRDRNGNSRWDPDVDDTLYRGNGTVTACPSSVTLAPK
jgi:hypothetical protein